MSQTERGKLRQLSGVRPHGPRPLLSDFPARRKSSSILIQQLGLHRLRANPFRQYFFLTFIDDMGNTSDRSPEVNLEAMRRKIDKAMRKMGLDGIVSLEVQALMNYPARGRGRTLMFHGHGVGWTTRPFNRLKAQRALNASRSWSNAFGAKPLMIDPVIEGKGQIEWLGYYMSKLPHDAKNRVPNRKKPGHFLLMNTTAGYRPELALRIFEGLSQIEIPDVVFGVGEGAVMRQAWLAKLLSWHKRRSAERTMPPEPFDVSEFWAEVRRRNGSKRFEPYRFLQGSERPTSVHG